MAKKKDPSPARRRRRTAEELIADLEAEIQRVKERQKARELKQSPANKAALAALRALDRGLDAAAQEGATALRHALADGRKSLAAYLERQGASVPKANLPKGRRPRG